MKEDNQTHYLFSPKLVEDRLGSLPALKEALGDPKTEGLPSGAFENARKSPKQIYRLLGNDHYPHLVELLGRIELCIEQGLELPALMRTSGGPNFASALAELRVAEQLLDRGWDLEELDVSRGQQSIPEYLARKDELSATIEVYCPRTREGVDQLMDSLMHAIKDLDRPLDYRFEIDVEQLNRFDDEKRLLHIQPETLAQGLVAATRERLKKALLDRINQQLDAKQQSCHASVKDASMNIVCNVKLINVETSTSDLPSRGGTISLPGFSGYAPEAMFDRLVRGRIRRKAMKGQGKDVDRHSSPVLVIDMTCSDLGDYFAHPTYIDDFKKSMQDHLREIPGGYEAIIFCDRTDGSGLRGMALICKKHLTPTVAEIAKDFGLGVGG